MLGSYRSSPLTGAGAIGHAHPSPVADPISSDDATIRHLEHLVAGIAFDIELSGLAFHATAPPNQMHCPRLRKSEAKLQATDVDHLDVVSCWKGISNAQALELALWERFFQQCLASQFENHMRHSIVAQLSEHRDKVDEAELSLYLIQVLPPHHKRLVRIDLPSLIHDMIDAFYSDHPSETAARQFRWSLGSEDLPSFLYNYIMTQDCFLRISDELYLSVSVSTDWYTMPVFAVVAHVAWQPPSIDFWRGTALHPESRGKDVLTLHCEYISEGLASSNYKHFPVDVSYVVKEYKTKGDIPTVSDTIVQANMVTQFPNDVRFQRASRYAVKGEVTDIHQSPAKPDNRRSQPEEASTPWIPSYTSTPQSKFRHTSYDSPVQHNASPLCEASRNEFGSMQGHSGKSHDAGTETTSEFATDVFTTSDLEVRAESPKKRKASLRSTSSDGTSNAKSPDHESDAFLKRQKLECSDGLSIPTASTSTNVIELQRSLAAIVQDVNVIRKLLDPLVQSVESHESDLPQQSNDAIRRLRKDVGLSPSLVPLLIPLELAKPRRPKGRRRMKARKTAVMPPTPVKERQDSLLRSPSPISLSNDSDHSDASAPNSASNVSDPGAQQLDHGISSARCHNSAQLSQDEIQKNYREFEEVAKRKMTDPPVSDVGDMNFERIFLGDSEVEDLSLGDVDGLSEGMSGLEMSED